MSKKFNHEINFINLLKLLVKLKQFNLNHSETIYRNLKYFNTLPENLNVISERSYLHSAYDENIINNMIEIVNSNDKTYSPLALYYLLDNNLISSIDEINKYFDIIIYELSLDQNLVDLNIYKKTLYNADSLTENELLNMIEPILKKENLWQSHAMYLLAEYYYSKGDKEKSLTYYKSIVSKTNSNSEIKLEARKRIQRDFSE